MTAILRFESRKLVRGTLTLTGLLVMLSVFFLVVFPAIQDEAALLEEVYPAYLLTLLGVEELHTLEGFVGGYLFPFIWILLAGIYFAYVSAGLISRDVRTRRMDLTLSNPVSRESVVLQNVAALWVPLVGLNAGLVAVLLVGGVILEESIDLVPLAMVHLLGIPYLLVCAGLGIVFSVAVDRVETAQATALVLVFVLWLVDGLSQMNPDFEWVGDLTPSRYYDPSAILVHEEYALLDAAILLVAFLVLVGLAVGIFVRRDI
ncbi:ABC transporter permease subunit [Natrarchaeobaculum sulfurireducens]|uniref:ABC-type transport system involved in multi-copper enzyme maturation, permease component n=1 Tax=Natrarchaeobaculum sulfurireducens TaxID=2044521 RepID=A0A346PJN7_9EURY|nr:ABC transporter permease subunit [Natrarchaeobaculum sulfurireducens]AXR79732.1 ABC-type transport system involved in multi-copper enzyme maturation, permease component [Natrarchaeobaculum sulfurireducens]